MDAQSSIRIIGGKWRSRKVSFVTKELVRPTPDRVRETLFNWLSPYIHEAVCLDLFAGSGVLGFEALSRGAKYVVALEKDRESCQQLIQAAQLLQTKDLEVLNENVLEWLQAPKFSADIIFVDPPYKENLLAKTLELLDVGNWLSENALVYFEQDKPLDADTLPANWSLWRSSKAGRVHYFLAIKEK